MIQVRELLSDMSDQSDRSDSSDEMIPQTAPHRGASREGGYPVTAWRTTCLYGVSYSRASPRLPDDVTYTCFHL